MHFSLTPQQCQRTLSHKRAEPGKTVENMQCRLDCESEKYSTLQLELYSTKAELQDIKEQQSKLRAEMEQTERDCRGEVHCTCTTGTHRIYLIKRPP